MHSGKTKVGITYLSLTGNTKTIAEKIGEELAVHGAMVSYYDLMDKSNRRDHPLAIDPAFLGANDMLGFGCFAAAYQPIYFFKKLLDGIGDLRGKPCFIFCTYGVKFGGTLESMRRSIARSGAVFLGGDAFASSDELKDLAMNRLYLRHDQPNGNEFAQARRLGARIATNLGKVVSGGGLDRSDVEIPRDGPLFGFLGATMFRQGLLRHLRRFTIDEGKCIRCGWCTDICPSQSLSLNGSSRGPIVDTNCQGCAMCYECRQGAIVPVNFDLGVRISARWASLFYTEAPRKTLDDRELELLRKDRFRVMKSRPELMSSRG